MVTPLLLVERKAPVRKPNAASLRAAPFFRSLSSSWNASSIGTTTPWPIWPGRSLICFDDVIAISWLDARLTRQAPVSVSIDEQAVSYSGTRPSFRAASSTSASPNEAARMTRLQGFCVS
ncbi:hypothetical protein [Paenibacillus naphthalenovorans]|uniref:hypothetical protein n=1 Tax=Paenibacillus naphthalenovorans TaxID=162209 RepID=UPI001113CE40|nr:hypothetical protein [Paenibacillus naphthalenovorans]